MCVFLLHDPGEYETKGYRNRRYEMNVYTINNTRSNHRVWLTIGGGWSDEWPDARQWRTRGEAQLYLDQARENNPAKYDGASVDETDVSESWQR
jgi:hypothetical protein